ncbi:sulfite exporter TauE/SafE family protein [Francisella sp. 19X1-34]|uniref:sulfite exporter TauE/SafE family protein n=1 Tax=Francisella sp. 19X1-34 TaxID=3087177 RepID=UPI002E33B649|nr:sulfite exporter TauE/SafE family protein [Francisella sp. 19X1-34]MED7789683.1 sulfite exporter TauE/SafE family protein [Francisella sp. 19X1-34]
MKLSLLLFITLIFLITIFSGFISGVFGGGSGLINVPGFYLLLHYYYASNDHLMQVAIACAVSSGVLVGLLATIKQHRYKQICYNTLRWALISILLGGVFGVFLVTLIKSSNLKTIFSILLIIMAIWMWRKTKTSLKIWQAPLVLKITSAFFAGVCTMLSGISVFFVPLLTKCGLDIRKAIGTSTIITFFISLVMTIFFIAFGLHAANLPPYCIGYLNLIIVFAGIIPSLIGVNIGVKVTASFSHKHLQIIYILMMFIIAIAMII